MIAGICGGIAEYLDLDPTIVRCVYAVLSVFTGVFPGVLLYVILIAVVPTD
jgi:phage shock protein C